MQSYIIGTRRTGLQHINIFTVWSVIAQNESSHHELHQTQQLTLSLRSEGSAFLDLNKIHKKHFVVCAPGEWSHAVVSVRDAHECAIFSFSGV